MEHSHGGPMAGRTVLVTGGTSGIGRATALGLAASPAQGARTSIHLASAPELGQVSGTYFADQRPTKSSQGSYDPEVATRLWEASADLVGLTATSRV